MNDNPLIQLVWDDGKKSQTKEFSKNFSFEQVATHFLSSKEKSQIVAVCVGEQVVDLSRLLENFEEGMHVRPVFFEDKKGAELIAHGTTHLMAYAIKKLYPQSQLATGPAIENGFFYDFDDIRLVEQDFENITRIMRSIIPQKLRFVRKDLTLSEAKTMFADQRYKQDLIEIFVQEGRALTCYFIGDIFVDLCKGPHVPHTGFLSHFQLHKIAGAHWRGKSDSPMLQRLYGLSFPTKEGLQNHLGMIQESLRRDHRKLGKELDLFFTHELSPGSPFLLPAGVRMYKALQKYLEKEYLLRHYEEVMTPNMFHQDLWKQSGHWDHYRENMFGVASREETSYSLKPMNCPSHMLIYQQKPRSYRDLPLRLADFGVLHRDELSGTLGGLTRVRRLCQDDAHIFCTAAQIFGEVEDLLCFVEETYKTLFGFEYLVELSTRPENFMGSIDLWEQAERALQNVLQSKKIPYQTKLGEGAFYGPKLDFQLRDAAGRFWQCATVQLDFQLPQRFSLVYEDAGGEKKSVVVIHRAILGSLERFLGVLIEHYEGKFPFWMHPEPIRIITVGEKFHDYAKELMNIFRKEGIYCSIDIRSESLSRKVRDAQQKKVFCIITVGQNESDAKTVSIRTMSGAVFSNIPQAEFIKTCKKLQENRSGDTEAFSQYFSTYIRR